MGKALKEFRATAISRSPRAILVREMPHRDTDILPGPGDFPSTHWSLLVHAGDPSQKGYRESLERLVTMYWRPVYLYIRVAWAQSNDDAKDFTQDFLTRLSDGTLLQSYDKGKGRFRAYLKGALRHFLMDQQKAEVSQKRGGGRNIVSMDEEVPVPAEGGSPDEVFDRAWAQSLLDQALREVYETLKRKGRERSWEVFDQYEIHPSNPQEISYRGVGKALGLTEAEVKSHLEYVRLLVRQALRKCAADTVVSEDDLYAELKELFG